MLPVVALADGAAPPVVELVAPPLIERVTSILTVKVLSLPILWSTDRPCTVMPVPSSAIFAVAPLAGSRFTFVKKWPPLVCKLFRAPCVAALWPVAFRLLAAWPPVDPLLSIWSPSEPPVVAPDVAFAPPVVADGAPAELLTLPAVELLTLPDVAPEVVALLDGVVAPVEPPIVELLLVAFAEVPLEVMFDGVLLDVVFDEPVDVAFAPVVALDV